MCQYSSKKSQACPIRPHHGMCLAYFIGNGYSIGFAAHMQEMLELFLKNIPVRLVVETDEICSACPNNREGSCLDIQKIQQYDRAVLRECGFTEGQEMRFLQFAEKVQEKIIHAEKREKICGDCQWNAICKSQKSRWTDMEKV